MERFGGKAANLARVQALGLRVPATVAVGRGALSHYLNHTGLDKSVGEYLGSFATAKHDELTKQYEALCAAMHGTAFPDELRQEMLDVADRLLHSCRFGLAVRSSAICEDAQRSSFAGVFESYLGIMNPKEVLERIVSCWCSLFSPRALRYMARMGLGPSTDGMAVMIQEVLPAECSGVIYTADPATGNPWQFVLHATQGRSIDLMSGTGTGDTFWIDWETGTIQEKEIAGKPAPPRATPKGVRTDTAAPSTDPAISDAGAAEVAGLARRMDEAFSTRLDIEWAITADGPWIVQARPLTGLPAFFPVDLDDAQRERTWKAANMVFPQRPDHPPNFLTPMYRDLSESQLWYRYQPEDIVLTEIWHEEIDVNGFRYCDTDPCRTFQDFFESPSQYERWLDKNQAHYRLRWDGRLQELDEIGRKASAGIHGTTTAAALIPIVFEVRDWIWDLGAFGWGGPQALGWMCEAALADFVHRFDPDYKVESLFASGAKSYTLQVTKGLQALGKSVHAKPVESAFNDLPLDQVIPHLMDTVPQTEFLTKLDAFCWKFGKAPPSWRHRPPLWSTGAKDNQIVHAIKRAWAGTARDVEEIQRKSLETRESQEQALRNVVARDGPHAVARLTKLLEWARYWTQALNDRHGLTVGLLWERELIWQAGVRLQDEGLLDEPQAILLLWRRDLEEIAKSATPSSFKGLYADRRREYLRNRRLTPPATLGRLPQEDAANAREGTAAASPARANDSLTFQGTGFSGGTVTGRTRKITNLLEPAVLDTLTGEDVLVLPHADAFHYADWHSLLTVIKGVVSPGRPSHHLSQVARECGVPVIGHVQGDLTRIPDGAGIQLDSGTGSVVVL